LTLDQLGSLVGKPAPYLSLLENGRKEPKLSLVMEIAASLDIDISELLEPNPPSRRDALEIALIRAQETSLFETLDIPTIKPTAKIDNRTLAHIVGLHDAVREKSTLASAGSDEVRRANGAVHEHLVSRNGYLADIETAAREALENCGYPGDGPFSSRNLTDLTANVGFELMPIDDMPPFARSIIDTKNKRIYIAQRNELRTRQARKAVLQTVAGFVLGHTSEPDLETFLRQRMESAYFAAAVLAPEDPLAARLHVSKEAHDIDPEDVKELFYLSYEMAAWRTANLLTRHLGIKSHVLVSDDMGVVVKGYANDGVPLPRDEYGGVETQRLCRRWGTRRTFDSGDRFATHYQYTDTPKGTYFCSTHVEAGRDPAYAITLGTRFEDARWFRGRETDNRETSTCPAPECCRTASPDIAGKWADSVIVSARSQSRILGLITPDPYPELDMPEVLSVVEAHSG
jgi:predicted transcriptional regulator/transcriptional regulator with XRE-family HTH domain